MTTPEHEPGEPSHTVYIASVRPGDNVACSDNHPLARVRFSNGKEFIGWRHVRHDELAAHTGRTLEYWQHIDALAACVVGQIQQLVNQRRIPRVTEFSELHGHFDANTGWGNDIDALTSQDWAAVQWRVTDRLRIN